MKTKLLALVIFFLCAVPAFAQNEHILTPLANAKFTSSPDDTFWSALGAGMVGVYYPTVSALALYDNKLIAGGRFTTAGGVSANGIASWDDSSWSPLGSGMGE